MWLNILLKPSTGLEPYVVEHPNGRIILFEIDAARSQPIRFKDKEYIRIGSSTTELREWPEKERALWRLFDRTAFEVAIATERAEVGSIATSGLPCLFPSADTAHYRRIETGFWAALAADKLITHVMQGGGI